MISIVCPFYNEKDNLKELYTRLRASLQGVQEPWEIIFVNDGSKDGGGEYLKSLIGDEESVRLVELDRNYGLTTALYAGFEASKGDILVTLDADLQNPPEEIPYLLSLMGGFDMVTGIRRVRDDSLLKKAVSKIGNRIRQKVIRDHIQDTGCSLRIFRRLTLDAFYPFNGMHRFFAGVAELHGFRIKQVPVGHQARRQGKSKYGFWNRLLGPFWDLIAIRWMLTKKINYKIRSSWHA